MIKRIIGVTGAGTYFCPWTCYGIAAIYHICDEIVIANGGFDLKNPKRDEFNVPLPEVGDMLKEIDINGKIYSLTNFGVKDLRHPMIIGWDYERRPYMSEAWVDVRGLNLQMAHEFATFDREATAILKWDSVPAYTPVIVRDNNNLINILPIESLATFSSTGQEVARPNKSYSILTRWDTHGQWSQIKYVLRHPFKGYLRRIRTRGGVIDVSKNHSIYKLKSPKVADADTIKVGDVLATGHWESSTIKSSFGLGHIETARAFGLYLAEGSTCHTKQGQYLVQLAMEDRSEVELVRHAFEDFFNVEMSFFPDGDKMWKIACSNKPLYAWLRENFYSHGLKCVPYFALNADKEYQRALLNGYLCGDGSEKDGAYWVHDASPLLLTGACYLWKATTGNDWSVNYRHDKNGFYARLNSGKKNSAQFSKHHFPAGLVRSVKDIFYEGYLYDVETESHIFRGGIGEPMVLHNTDNVFYDGLEGLRQETQALQFKQYEFRGDIFHLADPPPTDLYNDAPYMYFPTGTEWYYGGGGPMLAQERRRSEYKSAHLRQANPINLSDQEKWQHFYGRAWYHSFANEGIWGDDLEKKAKAVADYGMVEVAGIPSRIRPPEVCLTTPRAYINRSSYSP